MVVALFLRERPCQRDANTRDLSAVLDLVERQCSASMGWLTEHQRIEEQEGRQ